MTVLSFRPSLAVGETSAGQARAALGVLALLLWSVWLGGCGFQLRAWGIADAFQTARLQSDASVDLDRELRRALRAAGVNVVDGDADVVLEISEQRAERHVVAVSQDTRAAEYALGLEVRVACKSGDGTPLWPVRPFRMERVVALQRDNLLASESEQALVEIEMRADLIAAILRALGAAARDGAR